jgi:DNA replication initiation complex subunit (GINS family)
MKNNRQIKEEIIHVLKSRKVANPFKDEDWQALGELANRQVKNKEYVEYNSIAKARAKYFK